MKFGVCIGTTEFEKMEILKKLGYDYAEFAFSSLATLSAEDYENCKREVARIGISVESANSFLPKEHSVVGDNVDYDKLTEYLETGFARCSELGIEIVVFGSQHARNVPANCSHERANEQLIYAIKNYISPIAKKYSVTITIEPLSRADCNIINTVGEADTLAKASGCDNVFALADLYHMYKNEDSVIGLTKYYGQIKHSHIANGAGRIYPKPKDFADYIGFLLQLSKAGCPRTSIEGAFTNDFEKSAKESLELLREIDALIQ